MAAAPRRRPSALEPFLAATRPRSPLGSLCRGAAARAAHPGREAPLPPAPLPLARRGARAAAPTPPRALPRPPRPPACARRCPVAFSPCLSPAQCLVPGLPFPRPTSGRRVSEEVVFQAAKCSPSVCAKTAAAGLVSRPPKPLRAWGDSWGAAVSPGWWSRVVPSPKVSGARRVRRSNRAERERLRGSRFPGALVDIRRKKGAQASALTVTPGELSLNPKSALDALPTELRQGLQLWIFKNTETETQKILYAPLDLEKSPFHPPPLDW